MERPDRKMIVLGMDSSQMATNIALADDSGILVELSCRSDNNQLAQIIPLVDFALQSHKRSLADVDLIAAVTGPGLWSSLRIGLTAVRTISYVNRTPVVALSSNDAIACDIKYAGRPVYVMIDAKRKRVYWARYDCSGPMPERQGDISLSGIDKFLEYVENDSILIGDGVLTFQGNIRALSSKRFFYDAQKQNGIRPGDIIHLAVEKYAKSGASDLSRIVPNYIPNIDSFVSIP